MDSTTHQGKWRLFSGRRRSSKSTSFVLQVRPPICLCRLNCDFSHHSLITLISWIRSPDVSHFRYEGNRNTNMVEEQPEYPETDSPVGSIYLVWNSQFYSSSSSFQSSAHFQVWLLGRQYSARYDLAELRHLVTSRPWLTYRWKSNNVGSKIITWQRLTITQERLSCHWCIWPDKWPRLGLHAQMWSDGPRRGTSRY